MHETGFTKLFSSIVMSTIWQEDDKTRIVWITMLALANRYGEVGASVPGLADAARVSVEECRRSLEKLKSPDPDSRSREYEGRRIQEIDGGFLILNYGTYRKKMRSRAEYFREYRTRDIASKTAYPQNSLKNKASGLNQDGQTPIRTTNSTTLQHNATTTTTITSPQPIAEAEAKEKNKEKKRTSSFNPPSLSEVSDFLTAYCKEKNLPPLDPQEFVDFYAGKGWIVGKVRMKDWQAAARRAARTWERKQQVRPRPRSETPQEYTQRVKARQRIEYGEWLKSAPAERLGEILKKDNLNISWLIKELRPEIKE